MTRGGRVQSAATRFSHRPLGASPSGALRSPLAEDRPVRRHGSPLRGASSSFTSLARAPSGRAWQGPQMAAAPRRGWSRGGCRAPSRGSLGLALAAPASTGEGRRGEVSPELARVKTAAAKAQAEERGAQRSVRELARCAWPAGFAKQRWPRAGSRNERETAAVIQTPAPAGL